MQGAVAGAVQGAPDHVCHWPVSGCCRVLSRVLRIMFAIGRCQGAVQGAVRPGCCSGCSGSLSRVLRIMFAIGRCQGAVQGAVQGAPDHVCHWAVSGCCPGCCPGCSGSCLPLGGVRVLSRVLSVQGAVRVLQIMFAIGRCQVLSRVLCRGAVQGAPDHVCHWGVSVLSRVLSRVLRIMFAIGRCQGAVEGGVQGAVPGCC